MKELSLKNVISEEKPCFCTNCSLDLRKRLKTGKSIYLLENGLFVCTKRCLIEYALTWMLTAEIIKE